jgi:hypothetical protein
MSPTNYLLPSKAWAHGKQRWYVLVVKHRGPDVVKMPKEGEQTPSLLVVPELTIRRTRGRKSVTILARQTQVTRQNPEYAEQIVPAVVPTEWHVATDDRSG